MVVTTQFFRDTNLDTLQYYLNLYIDTKKIRAKDIIMLYYHALESEKIINTIILVYENHQPESQEAKKERTHTHVTSKD